MEIRYSSEKVNDILVFEILDKTIDHNNAVSLKEKIYLEITDGNAKIILNMINVVEMDSSGLGALLFGKRQAERSGGNLVLVAANEPIKTMIRIAQLTHVFDMFQDLDKAKNYFK